MGARGKPVSRHVRLDEAAIAVVCERFGVARLRMFGSALREDFDPKTSDVDFLVDFDDDAEATVAALLSLRRELEAVVGRRVDLVDAHVIRNPYFLHRATTSSRDVYPI